MRTMVGLTTMPSAPKLLSSWKICVVGTPLAFQTIQVSTVVAAHWMAPEAMARWRSFCGILLIVTSRPFFLKMPASLAKVSGAKPVQPEMPMPTLVSCARAAVQARAAAANRVKRRVKVFMGEPRVLKGRWNGVVQGSLGCSQVSVLVRLFRNATIWSISASLRPVGCSAGDLFGSGLPPPAM